MGRGDFQSCACPLSKPGARQETRGYSDNYHKSMKWGLERRKGNVPLLEEPKRPSAPALGWEAGWLSPTQWLPSGQEAFREMCMLGLQEGLCCFSGCFLILTASSILLSTWWSAPTIPGSGQSPPVWQPRLALGTVTLNGPIHGVCLQRALLPSGKVCGLPHMGPKETQGGGQKEPKSPHGQPVG